MPRPGLYSISLTHTQSRTTTQITDPRRPAGQSGRLYYGKESRVCYRPKKKKRRRELFPAMSRITRPAKKKIGGPNNRTASPLARVYSSGDDDHLVAVVMMSHRASPHMVVARQAAVVISRIRTPESGRKVLTSGPVAVTARHSRQHVFGAHPVRGKSGAQESRQPGNYRCVNPPVQQTNPARVIIIIIWLTMTAAQHISGFVPLTCCQEGHTYWMCKRRENMIAGPVGTAGNGITEGSATARAFCGSHLGVPARVLEQLALRWFDAELRQGRPEHKTCRNPLSDTAFGGYRA